MVPAPAKKRKSEKSDRQSATAEATAKVACRARTGEPSKYYSYNWQSAQLTYSAMIKERSFSTFTENDRNDHVVNFPDIFPVCRFRRQEFGSLVQEKHK